MSGAPKLDARLAAGPGDDATPVDVPATRADVGHDIARAEDVVAADATERPRDGREASVGADTTPAADAPKGGVACTIDGRVAGAGASKVYMVSCENLCVCFQENVDKSQSGDGNCHSFDRYSQCLTYCRANWNTPISLCCRAFRCTNALAGRLDVPGFPASIPYPSGSNVPDQHHARCGAAYRGTMCDTDPGYP
jgi:hypothetical protein